MQKRSCTWLLWCQLIVMIPGLQPNKKFPASPAETAEALTGIDQKTINKSIVSLDIEKGEGKINSGASPNLLLYDWSEVSQVGGIADDTRVGGVLATTIIKKCSDLKKTSKKPIDVLIIAHSRGCYVACQACRRLEGYADLGFCELVTLDPVPEGNDGELESNPGGVVDWVTNYHQAFTSSGYFKGRKIPDALNVNLDSSLENWKQLPLESRHSQVHRWYLGTLLQRGEITKGDNIQYIKLYGGNSKYPDLATANGPIIENFNGPISLVCSVFPARRLKGTTHTPELLRGWVQGQNRISGRTLLLTEKATWVGTSCLVNTPIAGDFVAEVSFQMTGKIGTRPADGIAFDVIESPITQPVGLLGGFHGFAGMGKGFAIVFDNYCNGEHNDPRDIDRRVGIRTWDEKQRKWKSFFANGLLPDSLLSGNRFTVRLTLIGRNLKWHIYCHGPNKSFETDMDLPDEVYVPNVKTVGVSASTGDGGQQHTTSRLRVYPLLN